MTTVSGIEKRVARSVLPLASEAAEEAVQTEEAELSEVTGGGESKLSERHDSEGRQSLRCCRSPDSVSGLDVWSVT